MAWTWTIRRNGRKGYLFEIRFEKHAQTRMSDIPSNMFLPNWAMCRHVAALSGLVDARMRIQGCSPWPPILFLIARRSPTLAHVLTSHHWARSKPATVHIHFCFPNGTIHFFVPWATSPKPLKYTLTYLLTSWQIPQDIPPLFCQLHHRIKFFNDINTEHITELVVKTTVNLLQCGRPVWSMVLVTRSLSLLLSNKGGVGMLEK
jgi:hypothetical protein